MNISRSIGEVAAEMAKIMKTDPGINTKKAKQLADVLKSESKQFSARPNTDAAMKGLLKWGLPPAAIGTSVGLGALAAGTGVKMGFGVSDDDPEEEKKSLSGWLIFLGVAAVVIVVFLPRIKEFLK